MSWQEVSIVSARREFVKMAGQEGSNVAQLCRRFCISRTTGYKWLTRAHAQTDLRFEDRSRRPKSSPTRTDAGVEASVIAVRRSHPTWGGRKIRAVLLRRGRTNVPAASTITGILARHGLIAPEQSAAREPFIRFEHEAPNRLWQMDFKGHFALAETAQRCHPLTIIDDHSRFAVELGACANERGTTVRAQLSQVFDRYGLPERINTDNGSPWGSAGQVDHVLTPLNVWLIRLGIKVSHSRPHHPQTNGKNERFNGTVKLELLRDHGWRTLSHAQAGFDRWRDVYNQERPHEGIGYAVPADRYEPSRRSFPQTLPQIVYPAGTFVRKGYDNGFVSFKGRRWKVPKALKGQPLGIDPTSVDGVFEVRFMAYLVTTIDLRKPRE